MQNNYRLKSVASIRMQLVYFTCVSKVSLPGTEPEEMCPYSNVVGFLRIKPAPPKSPLHDHQLRNKEIIRTHSKMGGFKSAVQHLKWSKVVDGVNPQIVDTTPARRTRDAGQSPSQAHSVRSMAETLQRSPSTLGRVRWPL